MYISIHKGKHLSYNDRIKIEALYRHCPVQEIARRIGVHPSTIYRELKRGQYEYLESDTWKMFVGYSADIAQRDYDLNATAKGPNLKIGRDHDYAAYLRKQILEKGYSPAAAISKAAQAGFTTHITKTTCYRYIRLGFLGVITYRNLPCGGKKKSQSKNKRPNVSHPIHTSIEARAKYIDLRQEFGHWEMDSVIGKAKGKGESCLVLTERKTRQEIILKQKEKTAASTVAALKSLRSSMGIDFQAIFKTITVDNGSEFADQAGMEKTGPMLFYCHPSCPSERGSNENLNKMVRRKFPKGQSLRRVTQCQCHEVQQWINEYPRPMFGGKSSQDLFFSELQKLPLKNYSKIFAFFT